MPSSRPALLVTAFALCAACAAVPAPGQSLAVPSHLGLREQVTFDHPCPPEKVIVLRRSSPGTSADLDVCGQVRRYALFHSPNSGGVDGNTWLDVTALFPATSLPKVGEAR